MVQYLLFAKGGFTDWVAGHAEDDLVKLFGLEEVFEDGEKNKRTGS
ncbi:MAG: hypothetical protein HDR18_02555 [Lachnospiraceae bacterium]|nr:hypothetical protein [Lachnospiraceae bacterium]